MTENRPILLKIPSLCFSLQVLCSPCWSRVFVSIGLSFNCWMCQSPFPFVGTDFSVDCIFLFFNSRPTQVRSTGIEKAR